MHFCTGYVSIAGDAQQIVFRGHYNPISWPETEVIRFVHGDDAVNDVHVFADVEQSAPAEKERLRLIYGDEPLKEVFPGRNPQMPMHAPDVKLVAGIEWKNPVTGLHERTEGDPDAGLESTKGAKRETESKGGRKREPEPELNF